MVHWIWILLAISFVAILFMGTHVYAKGSFEIHLKNNEDVLSKIPGPIYNREVCDLVATPKNREAPVSIQAVVTRPIPELPQVWHERMREFINSFGQTFKIWSAGKLYVYVGQPEDVKEVLENVELTKKDDYSEQEADLIGDGISNLTGNSWRRLRIHYDNLFTNDLLQEFVAHFNAASRNFTKRIRTQQLAEPLHFKIHLENCCIECTVACVEGRRVNAPKMRNEAPFKGLIKSWLCFFKQSSACTSKEIKIENMNQIAEDLRKWIKESIRREDIPNTTKDEGVQSPRGNSEYHSGRTLIKVIMDFQDKIGKLFYRKNNVLDQVMNLYLEGIETVQETLLGCVTLLACNKRLQLQLLHEVAPYFEDNGRWKEPKWEDYEKMIYLENVIKETLRLYPPKTEISRKLDDDIILPSSNLEIPSRTTLHINPYQIHRREDFWPKPREFDPRRFAQPLPHSCYYIPFSKGHRRCPGEKFAMLEMKVIIAHLIVNYKIKIRKLPQYVSPNLNQFDNVGCGDVNFFYRGVKSKRR